MKVITRGNYDDAFPMRITCKRVVDQYGFSYGDRKDFCGSVLEIEKDDIKKHNWDKYPDYKGTDYGVVCPVCKKFVVIDKGAIPDAVIKEAKEFFLAEIKNEEE